MINSKNKNLTIGLMAAVLFCFFTQSTLTFAAPISDRSVLVQLFEWTWKDVALECENFLGPKGFGAAQVSPPTEHASLPGGPWYERYQPVSYQLTSRSGTRAEFIDMVKRCKASGVDIIVDAVINHMTWVNRTGTDKLGSAGSPYGQYSYPDYQNGDFHMCGRNGDNTIQNYQDRWEVQNCDLSACADLKTESDYVRNKLAAYLNDLLSIGVAGFRIDAAKHIPAYDLYSIFQRVRYPFYNYQEVVDYDSEPIKAREYFDNGDVTEFRYAGSMSNIIRNGRLDWLARYGEAWGFLPSKKAVVFIDNHDMQRANGGYALTYKDGQKYVIANVFMLAWPYGYPQLMSSYRFTDSGQGPPTDRNGEVLQVYNGDNVQCSGDWICEHRWTPIANMVAFRNFTNGAPVSRWWSDGGNVIAFAREKKGYLVLNNDANASDRWFDTGLTPGVYCDVISGGIAGGRTRCTGLEITVNADGWAKIHTNPQNAVAIHGGARITSLVK